MSFDLSQFHQIFFEEVAEHLAAMERLLLDLDPEAPEAEDLNAIFRAAHSIKGGAATFGFADMAAFTHVLESLLERVRNRELAVTTELVDACLASGDVLRAQLAGHQQHQPADPAQAQAVLVRLEQLAAPGPAQRLPAPPPRPAEPAGRRFELHVPAGLLPEAETLPGLRDELARLGSLEIEQEADGSWRAELQGHTDEREIREVLGWLMDASQVSVHDRGEADGSYGFLAPVVREADPGYGFFDALPAAGAGAASDPGYGFFEPLPITPAATDPGYGLFEPLPAAPQEDPGYGFFTPLAQAGAAPAEEAWGLFEPAPQPPVRPAAAPPPPGEAPARKAPRRREGEGGNGHDSSIRVSVDKVDQLINLVGELVITHAMLAQSVRVLDPALFQTLHLGVGQLDRHTRDLQDAVLSIRMLPVSFVFNRFPRLVRELAGKLGKKVELLTEGEGTELDKGMIEKIIDPLTHLVRNSLDHGLELPAERLAAGKPAVGTVRLSAAHRGGHIVIEVADDGRGLHRERILAKARERGLPLPPEPSDQEVWQLIFAAGFSTAEQITDLSGRGVGMDVVKANIEAIGGRVALDSVAGQGTRITITLPLTMAILDGMSVAVGREVFVIPLASIIESLQPAPGQVRTVAGRGRVVEVRGEFLPLVELRQLFALPPAAPGEDSEGILVILGAGAERIALAVDALVGQQQVVIKSLESNYRKVRGIAGATIMGDGRVALILDVSALVHMGQSAA